MKVVVGSKNPVKIEATREVFSIYFDKPDIESHDAPSEVNPQPLGDETFRGAYNRAFHLYKLFNDSPRKANFYVGIEGGITKLYDRWFAFGCMCIIDSNKRFSYGLSPFFELPDSITQKLLDGIELGIVIDELTNQENTKQKEGAIGFFTRGVMNRKELYVEGLKTAIIPFLHEKLYFKYE
ncbi:inosine/xanthosine triphosphatase [Melioribacter sp. OK-6-Me]|uniref:inosine/xanthosine triphosphatase n=1 Tax=unclassified Melioribacter TaxID=2627329 RepID=UPI003EDAAE70